MSERHTVKIMEDDIDVEDLEEMVYVNFRIPLETKIDFDQLYIRRISENPKVKYTRSKLYIEVFEAGIKQLIKEAFIEKDNGC